MKTKLIYQGSRDGFSSHDLYRKVQGMKNCLALIRSHKGNVFGGYRSVQFDKNIRNRAGLRAFLFSLDR